MTEADWDAWTPQQLRPYFDAALEAFGAKRLMFGSDWPVCLVAVQYKQWRDTVGEWAIALTQDERARQVELIKKGVVMRPLSFDAGACSA